MSDELWSQPDPRARQLPARWTAVLPGQAELGRSLIARYAEPARRYHHVGHLVAVLTWIDDLAAEADDIQAVRLAAWYHDAVYDVRAADNEEQSAQLAVDELTTIGVRSELVDEVARLVRLTATHAPGTDDPNGRVLCDADLAILASPPERYDVYTREIRAEYAHVSDRDFTAGRSAVLRQLVELPALFGTDHGQRFWEPVARANLRRELGDLAAD